MVLIRGVALTCIGLCFVFFWQSAALRSSLKEIVQNALKQRPGFLKEITSKIPTLPDALRPHVMLAIQRWTKEISQRKISDCQSACGTSTSNSSGCEELVALNGRLNEFIVSLQNDATKECKGQPNEKSCLEQRHSSNDLIIAAVKEAIRAMASLVDPSSSCGIDALSALQHPGMSYTNGEFLACQLCYSFLQFLNTVVASGQTETSKTILKALGVAGEKVCVAINLPAILHMLVPALGNLDCNSMPGVIILVFQYVLSPKLGAQAQQTCSVR
ncbi:hypothetical protein Y032_0091g2444 [Ancylostoma ceylanicum]|uniref:Uncharacterized protein n=2 Tax=Ancylostoma ceylanicum TaxID=53326 RepID=A0A016TMR4_9BILA|nr:hypothetical protein Y032_0091g2444 [Ancylostoma ceylanicum]